MTTQHDQDVIDLADTIEDYIDNVRAQKNLQQEFDKVVNDEE